MPEVLSDGVLGKNEIPQILVDYDVILTVHPSSKLSKLNICIYRQKRFRLMKVVPNDSPTQVSYPHLILVCVNSITNRVIYKKTISGYDVIIVSVHRKLLGRLPINKVNFFGCRK